MLDAFLPGVRSFRRRHRVGHMAGKTYTLLLSFISNGEVSLTRQQRIDLHEVCSRLLHVSDRLSPFILVRHRNRSRPDGSRPIDDGTRYYHTRPQQRAFSDILAPSQQIRIAEHLADAGHAIGYEERKCVSEIPV